MTTTTLAPRADVATDEPVLACPRCKASLSADSCSVCGDVLRRDGAVLNFLGEATYVASRDRDRDLAAWLIDNSPEAAEALAAYEHGEPAQEISSVLGADVSVEELAALERGLPLQQIIDNIGDYRADVRRTSPTIDFLKQSVSVGPRSRVLDAGCSAGRHLLEWSKSGARLTGVDFRTLGLHVGEQLWPLAAASKPTWIAASITDLPLASRSFTHVVSCVVIGLVPARRTFAELARVLQPGGKLVLTVEGPGFTREVFDKLAPFDRRRLALSRWWLGRKLMEWDLDWQGSGILGRLSSLTQYGPDLLGRLANEAGLVAEKVEVLSTYRGAPRLVGLVAAKPGA